MRLILMNVSRRAVSRSRRFRLSREDVHRYVRYSTRHTHHERLHGWGLGRISERQLIELIIQVAVIIVGYVIYYDELPLFRGAR